jgi:perosamine synthetase
MSESGWTEAGAEPMRRIGTAELEYVKQVLAAEFRSSSGATFMRRLEQAFAERFGSAYAISFVNGTATMHAALEAMGIGEGDEVIVPPLTMSATTFAVLQANATPVFADVDGDTFQIAAASIEERITPRTRAIITVALYGLSPDMDPIMSIASKHGIKVIEDNAECFLGRYKGRLVGTIGHCSSFSFQSSKHLTSGEGGMVLTDDIALAENIRKVQSLGYAGVGATKARITKRDIQDPGYSRHVSMGWNYRMPELCCAVALAQVENIDALVGRRVAAAKLFAEATRESHEWFTPQRVGPEYENSYWTWVCRNKHPSVGWHEIRNAFVAEGGHGVYAAWKLTYLEPMFTQLNLLRRERYISAQNLALYKPGLCPVAEAIHGQLFQFKTNYWDLGEAHRQADILRTVLRRFG